MTSLLHCGLPDLDTLCSVSPADNCCHFVLLDKDASCPTSDLSNIGRPNGPAYSTSELLNMPQMLYKLKSQVAKAPLNCGRSLE